MKGPRVRTSVVVVIVGVLLAIPGLVVAGLGFWHAVFGPTVSVPGTDREHLGAGTYIVFEHTGSGQRDGPLTITRDDGVTIDSSQLRVSAADGRTVRVRNTSPNETISRNTDTYTSAVEFTTPRTGDYVLRFRTPDRGQVMIRRPLDDLLRRAIPWILEIAAGGLLALAGVAMLIVGAVRRGRTPRPALTGPVSTGTPAAWYPDPSGHQRLRYWDGTQWTDHTAD